MSLLLKALGAWVVFDGVVSLTYFAWKDGTLRDPVAQGVRVVRTLVGLALVVLS